MKQVLAETTSLPDGWKRVKVADVCESIDYGYTASANFRISTPKFLRITDIQNGRVDWEAVPGCELNTVQEEANLLRDGDVVFARTGGTTGKSFLIHKPPRAVFASYLIRLRPNARVTSDFIYAFFQSKDYWQQVNAHARGGAQPNVNASLLGSMTLPLPPLPEQKRIAGILKKQLAVVEQSRAAAEAQLEAAEALPAAYMRDVFEGESADQWPLKRIGDFAKVQSGYAFKSDWFVPNGIRLLRNANIFQGRIEWSDVVHLPKSQRADFSAFELNANDIVLTLDRPIVSNGLKVARLSEADLPALLLQRVGRFQLFGGIDANYLYAFLSSPSFTRQIRGHDQSLGVPHISPKQVEAVKLPVPGLEEQHRLAARIDQRRQNVGNLCASLRQQLKTIDAIPAGILRSAFQGRL